MRYKKFIINRYKAITKPIEIDVEKKSLIPIIGINECGKTTILNSIFAFDFTNDLYNPSIRHLTDVHNLYSTKNDVASISAEIEISLEEYKDIYNAIQQELVKEGKKPKISLPNIKKGYVFPSSLTITREIDAGGQSKYKVNRKELLKGLPDENEFCNEVIRNLPFILYFDDFRDLFPDKIEIKLDSKDPWMSIIEELFIKTNESYSIHKLASIDKRQRNSILSDVEKKLNNTLTKEWSSFRLDDREVLQIKIDFEISETLDTRDVRVNNYIQKKQEKIIRHFLNFEVVEKSPEGIERTFYVKDRSKGFYWFFNFVMKLEFNDKTIDGSSNAIYLLDEPGSYLHPYAQNKLCKKLINLSRSNKVIYCTHTHYLLDPEVIPLNTIHIAEKSAFNSIRLQRFDGYDRSNKGLQSAFQPIFDALYLKPFNLDFTYKKVLIVEGIYDYYSFELFRERKDYGIIPGKGASSLINVISIMIGFDMDFKVLWDNDEEGLRSFKAARDYFGDEMADKHFSILQPEKTKMILQNLFEGSDLNLIKNLLQLSDETQFNKIVASLFFSKDKDSIIAKVSAKTKENFRNILCQLKLEQKDTYPVERAR